MAEAKKTIIVIKKITINGGGHHGGAWKVAFADFMTAMMAFFLCMWLLAQNDETKKAISDYFSTPSVIEYEFRNFGVELTLEKLFNDLLNEPLTTVSKLFEPMDKTPNVFEFGLDKVALSYIAETMGDEAKNIEMNRDEVSFVIPDLRMFKRETASPSREFLDIMDKVKQITVGLKDSVVTISSELFIDGVAEHTEEAAKRVASQRLDLVKNKIQASFEHESAKIAGKISVKGRKDTSTSKTLTGFIRFNIKKNSASKADAKKMKIDNPVLESTKQSRDLYDELNDQFRSEVRKH